LLRLLNKCFSFILSDLKSRVPLPLMLIYKGLPFIKLLLFKAFLNIVTIIYIIIKLVIIKGVKRTVLYKCLIKNIFLIYFYFYIYLNIILLLKL
jgi:hypothetical protein